MAETTTPRATHEDLDLLAHIAAGRVIDNLDAIPMLTTDDQPHARQVAEHTWALYRAGWVHQLEGEAVWRLTFRGRDVLQGRPTDG